MTEGREEINNEVKTVETTQSVGSQQSDHIPGGHQLIIHNTGRQADTYINIKHRNIYLHNTHISYAYHQKHANTSKTLPHTYI